MTSDVAASVTMVQEVVANAARLGLTWKLRPATVFLGGTPPDIRLIMDGDDTAISAMSLLGTLTAEDRVMCLIVPPQGVYVIGRINYFPPGLPPGGVYVAGAGLTESPLGTFNVVNTDGFIVISANAINLSAAAVAAIGAGPYTAGAGLTNTPANTFNVANTDGYLVISADSVDFSGIAAAVIAAGPATTYTAGAGLTNSPAGTFNVVNTDGNLTVTADSVDFSAAAAATIAGAMKKYSIATVGDGVSTTIDITHGISGGVTVVYGPTLMDNGTGDVVIPQFVVLSSTQFRLVFGAAPTLNQYTLSVGY